jgi:hypothetical protein
MAPSAPSKLRDEPAWEPLAGTALLDRLRLSGRPRPAADPALPASLARRLDEGLGLVPHSDGDPQPISPARGFESGPVRPVVVTKGRLTRALSCDDHAPPVVVARWTPGRAMACGAIVDALFRQLVTVGSIGDAAADGLAALRVDGRNDELLAWVADLAPSEWSALVAEVESQAEGLRRRWPRLDPAWLPRTQDPMRVAVAGGAFELATRVDLALGVPGLAVTSVALVEVKSGAPRPEHRDDLRFAALVETLRHGAPPFVVATYYTTTGELDVDAVTTATLDEAVERTMAGARRLRDELAGRAPGSVPAGMCATCHQMAARRRPDPAEPRPADAEGSARSSPSARSAASNGACSW